METDNAIRLGFEPKEFERLRRKLAKTGYVMPRRATVGDMREILGKLDPNEPMRALMILPERLRQGASCDL